MQDESEKSETSCIDFGLIDDVEPWMAMAARDSNSRCAQSERPGQTASVALAEIVRRHGVDASPREIVERAGRHSPEMDLLALLLAARRCGFDALPLEGEYADLPEVPRPNIVLFHRVDGMPDFMVLLDIDADGALIGDTLVGRVRRLDREEFTSRWTGDAVQLLPNAVELAAFRRDLEVLRSPWSRLGRSVGFLPMTPKKVLFAVSVFGVGAAVCVPAAPSALALALRVTLGLAAVLSLWLTCFVAACRGCSGAVLLVGGLRLAPAGAALYGGFLGASILAPGSISLFTPALSAAAGAHASLVLLLLRSRERCGPCYAIAVSVLAGVVVAHMLFPVHSLVTGIAVTVGFIATRWSTGQARRLFELELRDGAIRLAVKTLAEPADPGIGRVRLVVYTRRGCPACNYYETVVRSLIEQDFGDALVLDERQPQPGQLVATPLFVVRGSADFMLDGFGTEQLYERLGSVLRAALAPGSPEMQACRGLWLVRPEA